MTMFLAEHNVPIAVMDHMSPMLRDIFPDSAIAKRFSCARTKATCIINDALCPHFETELVDQMKTNPFSLAIDGSNDTDLQKMNPVTVRIFDEKQMKVATKFLEMCLTTGVQGAPAEAIFSALNVALTSRSLLWENCVGLSVDNASVNMGKHNSLLTRAKEKNSSIYMMGCPCHILHNTAQKAARGFRNVRENNIWFNLIVDYRLLVLM